MGMSDRSDATDQRLVQQFLGGSEAAFRQLYRRHTPRMRGLVLRLLGAAGDEADDVIQESWLRACAGLRRFRWESALSTWLCGISMHTALEALRQSDRWADGAALEHLAAADPPPGEGIDLARALAGLPARQRAVIVLHDIEGYTHEEIAALLEIVPGTSKSQLAHAHQAMRGALARVD